MLQLPAQTLSMMPQLQGQNQGTELTQEQKHWKFKWTSSKPSYIIENKWDSYSSLLPYEKYFRLDAEGLAQINITFYFSTSHNTSYQMRPKE